MATKKATPVKHVPTTTGALAQVLRARISEAIGLRNAGHYKEMEEALARANKAMAEFTYEMTKKN